MLTFICIYLLQQPSVVNYLLLFISSKNVGGVYDMVNHMDLTCFDSTGYWLFFVFNTPGVLIWMIIVPEALWYKRHYCKGELSLGLKIMIGAMSIAYRSEIWYWGLVVIITKSLLMMIVNWFATDIQCKAIMSMGLLTIYLYFFIQRHPYKIRPHRVLHLSQKKNQDAPGGNLEGKKPGRQVYLAGLPENEVKAFLRSNKLSTLHKG